jgi:hypothetical protein
MDSEMFKDSVMDVMKKVMLIAPKDVLLKDIPEMEMF